MGKSTLSNETNDSFAYAGFSDSVQLADVFTFWNGDEYKGQFLASREKEKITRHGTGVYKTSDNQVYEGVWEDDSLVEDCKIVYNDKSTFYGTLEKMVIQGPGRYTFKENVEVEGEFLNNNLLGKVYLQDPNAHFWMGEVKIGDAEVFFYPMHPFWQSVLNLPLKEQIYFGAGHEGE